MNKKLLVISFLFFVVFIAFVSINMMEDKKNPKNTFEILFPREHFCYRIIDEKSLPVYISFDSNKELSEIEDSVSGMELLYKDKVVLTKNKVEFIKKDANRYDVKLEAGSFLLDKVRIEYNNGNTKVYDVGSIKAEKINIPEGNELRALSWEAAHSNESKFNYSIENTTNETILLTGIKYDDRFLKNTVKINGIYKNKENLNLELLPKEKVVIDIYLSEEFKKRCREKVIMLDFSAALFYKKVNLKQEKYLELPGAWGGIKINDFYNDEKSDAPGTDIILEKQIELNDSLQLRNLISIKDNVLYLSNRTDSLKIKKYSLEQDKFLDSIVLNNADLNYPGVRLLKNKIIVVSHENKTVSIYNYNGEEEKNIKLHTDYAENETCDNYVALIYDENYIYLTNRFLKDSFMNIQKYDLNGNLITERKVVVWELLDYNDYIFSVANERVLKLNKDLEIKNEVAVKKSSEWNSHSIYFIHKDLFFGIDNNLEIHITDFRDYYQIHNLNDLVSHEISDIYNLAVYPEDEYFLIVDKDENVLYKFRIAKKNKYSY